MIQVRVRKANLREINTIQGFYRAHPSAYLPLPQTKLIADTIRSGRMLVVDTDAPLRLLAVAALFELTPTEAATYVAELSGMARDKAIAGLKPISVQVLLAALRVIGFVVSQREALSGTHSLISIVKKNNDDSRRNLERAGFKPMAGRPDWMKFDELGWHGKVVTDEWTYHYADHDTVVTMLKLVGDALFDGQLRLSSGDGVTHARKDFVVDIDLPDILRAVDDLIAIRDGRIKVDLVPPPPLELSDGAP
ncbi:MAG: hypothetical protein WC670_04610 [Pseudolabrys sp.]|jgi:hypothetical protein